MYWQRLGDLPYKLALQKVCGGNAVALQSLCDERVIKIIDGMICIDFLNEQLAEFEDVSKTNSENARSGWEKRRANAVAKRSQSERNASREEESTEEEKKKDDSTIVAGVPATIDQRKKDFYDQCAKHVDKYSKEMLREFYNYWTEMNDGGKKMRFEMQKIFGLERRLATWKSNEDKKINGNGKQNKGTSRGSDAKVEYKGFGTWDAGA